MIKIYGKNCIYEAIRNKSNIIKLFICNDVLKKDNKIEQIAKDRKYNYQIISKEEMNKIFKDNHQGYGAYREDYKIYDDNFLNNLDTNKGRILLLDGIEDPHNLGAIIRSVDAFGFDYIILPKNRSVSLNETACHVSTGAIEFVKIAYVNSLSSTIEKLKKLNYWIVGTDASGNVDANDIDKNLNLAIIIGSEGFGMSKTILKQCDYLLSIPMCGHVNSLNASVSAGIVLSSFIK